MKIGEEKEIFGSRQHSLSTPQRYPPTHSLHACTSPLYYTISQFWEPVQQPRDLLQQPKNTSLEQSLDIGLEQSSSEQPEAGAFEVPEEFGEQGFEEGTHEKTESNSVFPEAIPGGQALLHTTRSEITPAALVSTGGGRERGQALTHIPPESR